MAETYEQRTARLLRWRHNGFFGGVEMARQTMRAIETAPTATTETKQLAAELHQKLEELRELLRKRTD